MHNNAHCAFAGISHALRLFDLRNAFYCVPLEHHDELYGLCDDFNSVMFQQVLNNPISVIPCADGHVCLLPERGVPPGLTAATDIFNWSYSAPLKKFQHDACTQLEIMNVNSPISGKKKGTQH